jgi:thymidylate synthase
MAVLSRVINPDGRSETLSMKEYIAEGVSLPEAYHKALEMLDKFGEHSPCPDYSTTQKELSMTVFVTEPLKEPMISKLFIGGYKELEQYRQEMLDGILDFEIERGNWAYTYHSRMAEQIPFIEKEAALFRPTLYSRNTISKVSPTPNKSFR